MCSLSVETFLFFTEESNVFCNALAKTTRPLTVCLSLVTLLSSFSTILSMTFIAVISFGVKAETTVFNILSKALPIVIAILEFGVDSASTV